MLGFGQDIGIDLGTATIIAYVKGKGVVLREPSVVAVDNNTKEVLAVGQEARRMLGRTPGNIVATRPLREGVISDYTVTEKMLKYFINKVKGKTIFAPRTMICIPSRVTEVEKKAVIDAAMQAGARKVFLIEEPIAAAIGAGLDIAKPCGNMIVDIGGGTTDIAVISLGGSVESTSLKVAGDKFDESIVKYIKKKHNPFEPGRDDHQSGRGLQHQLPQPHPDGHGQRFPASAGDHSPAAVPHAAPAPAAEAQHLPDLRSQQAASRTQRTVPDRERPSARCQQDQRQLCVPLHAARHALHRPGRRIPDGIAKNRQNRRYGGPDAQTAVAFGCGPQLPRLLPHLRRNVPRHLPRLRRAGQRVARRAGAFSGAFGRGSFDRTAHPGRHAAGDHRQRLHRQFSELRFGNGLYLSHQTPQFGARLAQRFRKPGSAHRPLTGFLTDRPFAAGILS